MDAQMTKADVLERMQNGYRALSEVLAGLSPAQMEEAGVQGDWSAKDIVAHMAEWDRRLVSWLEEIQRGTLPRQAVDSSDTDQVNDEIYRLNKDKPVGVVLADFRLTHRAALNAVSRVPDETLETPPVFEGYADFDLRQLIAWETWEHYQEHGEAIADWARGQ
jgi:hypothetical protein